MQLTGMCLAGAVLVAGRCRADRLSQQHVTSGSTGGVRSCFSKVSQLSTKQGVAKCFRNSHWCLLFSTNLYCSMLPRFSLMSRCLQRDREAQATMQGL